MRHAGAYLRCSVWGGVVDAASGETAQKLLSRADSALYSARAEGGSCLFHHTGTAVRRHSFNARPIVPASSPDPDTECHEHDDIEMLAAVR